MAQTNNSQQRHDQPDLGREQSFDDWDEDWDDEDDDGESSNSTIGQNQVSLFKYFATVCYSLCTFGFLLSGKISCFLYQEIDLRHPLQ